jgi:hypothetical protein
MLFLKRRLEIVRAHRVKEADRKPLHERRPRRIERTAVHHFAKHAGAINGPSLWRELDMDAIGGIGEMEDYPDEAFFSRLFWNGKFIGEYLSKRHKVNA